MKALVTGGAGFIGSHLAEYLLGKGHDVSILDNFSTGRYENIAHLEKNPKFQIVDDTILNEFIVDKLISQSDMVFHLAAAVGVKLIIEKPLEALITNIKGSELVLESAARYHKKVLIASTSEIYGKNVNGPLKEGDDRILGVPQKSRWSYSTAKAVDEILAYAYWKKKKLPVVVVRLFNVVGPRQTGYYGMVLPRFIEQALKNSPITVYGTGTQSRCFLYVGDTVDALYRILNEPKAEGEVFNIGSQEEITIEDLARLVIRLTSSKSKITHISYNEAYEEGFEDMIRRVPDVMKIRELIAFKPKVKLEDTINLIINEYKSKKLC